MSELEKTQDQREVFSSPLEEGFLSSSSLLRMSLSMTERAKAVEGCSVALSGLGMTLALERPTSPACPGLKFFLVLFSEGKQSCVGRSRMNHSSKKGK